MTKTLALTALLGLSTLASAQPGFIANVPNATTNSCNTCHTNGGGTPRNDFGLDYQANPTWADIYELDSDGDGCSNGQELGDAAGEFVAGGAAPGPFVSDPADPDDSDCSPTNPNPTDPVPTDDTEAGGCSMTGAPATGGLLLLAGLLVRRSRQG